jgi:hypothetical protein
MIDQKANVRQLAILMPLSALISNGMMDRGLTQFVGGSPFIRVDLGHLAGRHADRGQVAARSWRGMWRWRSFSIWNGPLGVAGCLI